MLCGCCGTAQDQLYCADCLNEGVAAHQALAKSLESQCKDSIARSQRHLEGPRGLNAWRELRADVANTRKRVEELRRKLTPLPTKSIGRHPTPIPQSVAIKSDPPPSLQNRLIHARQVLCREAVNVFCIRKGEVWEIAGFPLPPPEDFKNYPASSINAAIHHTLHLLRLLTDYLAIELPFIPSTSWSRPTIAANLPYTSTKRYRGVYPLYISKSSKKFTAFLTGYGLLSHSVAYLAWSQGVQGVGTYNDVDSERESSDDEQNDSRVLISATSILELLLALSEESSLGVQSHAPGTKQLNHIGFGLDVKRVVQAVLAVDDYGWEKL